MKKNSYLQLLKFINKPILILTLVYAVLGAFLILDASSISATLTYGTNTPYYFFQRQLIFIGISLVLGLLILSIPTKSYKALSLVGSMGLLVLLFGVYAKNQLFSSSVNEVTLSLFGGSFQPAEFIKVLLIIYMGAFYGTWANSRHKKWSFIIPIILCALAVLVILLGGDFGSATVMITLFALIFLAIPSKDHNVKLVKTIAVFGMLFGIFILKFSYLVIPQKVLESDYRLNRFVYKNPCDRYEDNSGYQVCNGYIAIDNGGLLGSGIGKSVQKYLYLPASHTDFIFPIIIEELGSIVGVLIIAGYMVIIYFVFKVATNCYKLQNSIICYGIGIYFMLHIFVNLCGVLGIIPLTGVPLPFLSYGGSFCVAIICSFAIIQRINIENKLEKKIKELNKINK